MFRVLQAAALATMAASGMSLPHSSAYQPVVKHSAETHVMCRAYQHITTRARPGTERYIVRNDNYGRLRECLSNRGHRPNFTIVKSGALAGHIEPVAYPDIFSGCSWGICTPHSGLPRRADRLHSLVTSWSTVLHAHGQWAAGYDIWFSRSRSTSGQARGAELMIWLASRGFSQNGWPVVSADGARWHLAHWTTARQGKKWNYIQFRLVRRATSVRNLDVLRFVRVAERMGLIKPRWWLSSVEAGFEIWRGGVGLGTKSFSVRTR